MNIFSSVRVSEVIATDTFSVHLAMMAVNAAIEDNSKHSYLFKKKSMIQKYMGTWKYWGVLFEVVPQIHSMIKLW